MEQIASFRKDRKSGAFISVSSSVWKLARRDL